MIIQYNRPLTPLNLDNGKYIVVHHIAGSKATAQDVHDWHLARGWAGAGYNEYITKDGKLHMMRGDHVGAHTLGYNDKSYGIALEGDFNKEYLTTEQHKTLVDRLVHHQQRLKGAEIVGHGELTNTMCPGIYVDMGAIKGSVKRVMDNGQVITDINEALDILFKKGIINSKGYWLKTIDTVNWQREFILNIANFVK